MLQDGCPHVRTSVRGLKMFFFECFSPVMECVRALVGFSPSFSTHETLVRTWGIRPLPIPLDH